MQVPLKGEFKKICKNQTNALRLQRVNTIYLVTFLLEASSCNKFSCLEHLESTENSFLQLTGFSIKNWYHEQDLNKKKTILCLVLPCLCLTGSKRNCISSVSI